MEKSLFSQASFLEIRNLFATSHALVFILHFLYVNFTENMFIPKREDALGFYGFWF